jgi:hypothetical protein
VHVSAVAMDNRLDRLEAMNLTVAQVSQHQ